MNQSTSQLGHLFVISGASGTGKTTLCRALEQDLNLFFSVSATTRPKRSDEIPGKDYLFLSDEEFDRYLANRQFLEWALVHDRRYGTLRGPIEEHLSKGQNVLLDIDTQGARKVKEIFPEATLIFLMPPDQNELWRRLESRGTESPSNLEKRFQRSQYEIDNKDFYDYIVVNENIEDAKRELVEIVTSFG